ncbi:MAG: hypothetical protein LQ342_000710 [Letrouitia transgressa]|nr:MAG: hypothetical protein LQ342_000710 [Letrouitia transgressa]
MSTLSHQPPPAKVDDEKQVASLQVKIASLTRQIADIEAKNEDAARKLRWVNPDAACTVNKHIELLHTYNEIRDVGTGLMGIIADNRGVRVKDVYRDFDVGEKD